MIAYSLADADWPRVVVLLALILACCVAVSLDDRR